jgi:ABC-2 type transport system permease protein
MCTYVWLGQAFFATRYIAMPKDVGSQIENGNICYNFVRPLDLYNQWYAGYIGQVLSATILRFLPILIIAFLLPSGMGMTLPVSFDAFCLFLIALLLGLLLNGALSMFAVYLSFVTLSSRGSQIFVNTLTSLLGGGYIALPLLPQGLQNVLNALPFRYVSDLPFRIYIGNIGINDALMYIAISVAWLVALVVIGKLLIKHALKKTVIQGG